MLLKLLHESRNSSYNRIYNAWQTIIDFAQTFGSNLLLLSLLDNSRNVYVFISFIPIELHVDLYVPILTQIGQWSPDDAFVEQR